MATFTSPQLEDLQTFLKEWLRHHGRTQSDLRRALRAGSIRMPVLLEELQRLEHEEGLAQLAAQLCAIEEQWLSEQVDGRPDEQLDGQLDLLLQEILQDAHN
ncbi:hypothetical protein KBY97_13405 [Synechococcus sp. ATX 2A4]|uniref:hypothetical protein n=1 Tax=Synechococcus sp. ATX 2A4 TaxID=2823727 RepID=UPI0020CEE199|nr:hypothetical protein [Synechococcus sp. ATX 2A4]MCP9886110.1 hypothetical protein [Synechococcus sp. ATX 2A4]